MKYSVMGFNQERAVELGLDLSDLALLGWIRDFVMKGNMKSVRKNGRTLYWVSYSTLLEDLPIIGFDKRRLARRLSVLENKKVLIKYVDKKAGNITYCGFGDVAKDLVYTMDKNIQTYGQKSPYPMDKNVHTLCTKKSRHIPNTTDLSTITDKEEKKEESTVPVHSIFDSYGKIYGKQ